MEPGVRLWKNVSRFAALRRFPMKSRRKLQAGCSLRPGDVANTCSGWNDVIETIEPSYNGMGKRGRVLIDFDIVFKDGSCCSWMHCCSLPRTKEESIQYFLGWDCPEGWETIKKWRMDDLADTIRRLRAGEDLVGENGMRK